MFSRQTLSAARLVACLLPALWLAACDDSPAEPPATVDVGETGGVATSGGGNPYDQVNPGVIGPDLSKADGNAYVVPTLLPPLEDPEIIVSLEGLTVELIDTATGFHKVYPTGVGARGSDGRSYTPVGQFTTHPDPNNGWFWYARRYDPAYFDGLPFLRITARNAQGYQTYGLHGPITHPLQRGFVSHGCMRMDGDDIVEIFYMMRRHPGASVTIQQAKRRWPDGRVIDVTPAADDPVAAYRAQVCQTVDTGHGELLAPGRYADRTLCEGEARYRVAVARGDQVRARVSAAGPITLALEGPATSERAPGQSDGTAYTAEVDLRLPEAGHVMVRVLGATTRYTLEIEHTPFAGEAIDVGGWIGDGCQQDSHCDESTCEASLPGGLCTVGCDRYCPDRAGEAATFCVDLGFDDQGRCVSRCADDGDCRIGYRCLAMPRLGEPGVTRSVCLPSGEVEPTPDPEPDPTPEPDPDPTPEPDPDPTPEPDPDPMPEPEPMPEAGWIGSACADDSVCGGARCEADLPGGLCTEACDRYCPDREGFAPTFCVDLGVAAGGRCVSQCDADADCRPGYSCQLRGRHGQPAVARRVCLPTPEPQPEPEPEPEPEPADGWIGSACAESAQCGDATCLPALPGGLCTAACERFCPDLAGFPATFCVDLGFDDGGRCVSQCAGDADCREGYACTLMPRYNEAAVERRACVPVR